MVRKSAGMERDFRGFGGSEGTADSNSSACSGPGKPTGVPGLNHHPLGAPHSEQISRNREGPLGDQGIGEECSQHLPYLLRPQGAW